MTQQHLNTHGSATGSYELFGRVALRGNNALRGRLPFHSAAAATKIDVTRVGRGQLPALSGAVTNATSPVPGGPNCVPRIPAGPTYSSTACGNIWEAMKWEKRMETAYTGFAQWYFDGRGWGDLVEGTATEFPVPYQELAARQLPFYSLGGGGKSSAIEGTYGF